MGRSSTNLDVLIHRFIRHIPSIVRMPADLSCVEQICDPPMSGRGASYVAKSGVVRELAGSSPTSEHAECTLPSVQVLDRKNWVPYVMQ